jgi:serine/threonine-protein kinase
MTETMERLRKALADRYRVERELGAGGMATVYLAHDLRHGRDVAIKALLPELAVALGGDRFLAEIRTTARLQHPHILPLLDSGEADGLLYYVMPFISGESLRKRLARDRQLPIDEAVRLAGQVANALGHAHAQGIIHRDIKPENILLQDGHALVADFGIALAVQTAGGARMTQTGLSLGTPQYMSPEQAMGEREITARSDVYALGCVLYEMLLGEPPFTGPTVQAIVAKVMNEKPAGLVARRERIPADVEDAVLTALEKLPADRFATATEFGAALAGQGGQRTATGATRRKAVPPSWRRPQPVLLAALVVAIGAALWGWLRPVAAPAAFPPSRLAIVAPMWRFSQAGLTRQVGITPDGSTLLMVSANAAMMRMALDDTVPTALAGVDAFVGGLAVSADGRQFVGSTTETQDSFIYPLAGGTGRPLPKGVVGSQWVAWASDGTLWLSSDRDIDRGLTRVSPEGEVSRPFGAQHSDLIIQQLLPGDRFALTIREPTGTAFGPLVLLDLSTGEEAPLEDGDFVEARYTPGFLVCVRSNGSMEALPFDTDRRQITGEAVTIAAGVSLTGSGVAQFAVAQNGTVVYLPDESRSLVYVDRQSGATRRVLEQQRNFHHPRFSPDGRRIALDFNAPDGRDVWVLDRADTGLTRVTFDRDGHDATWTPDGSLIYSTLRDGLAVFRVRPGNTARAESLFARVGLSYSGLWLPDGSGLVTTASALLPGSRGDIGLIPAGARDSIEPLVATRFEEQWPAVSPDGRWLAFASNQSGSDEIYLRAMAGGEEVQVSLGGGTEPLWSPDGRELFYRSALREGAMLMAATIATSPSLAVTRRQALFPVGDVGTATPHTNYDISPDGKTFVMVRLNPSSRIMVIQNLHALVRRLTRR